MKKWIQSPHCRCSQFIYRWQSIIYKNFSKTTGKFSTQYMSETDMIDNDIDINTKRANVFCKILQHFYFYIWKTQKNVLRQHKNTFRLTCVSDIWLNCYYALNMTVFQWHTPKSKLEVWGVNHTWHTVYTCWHKCNCNFCFMFLESVPHNH